MKIVGYTHADALNFIIRIVVLKIVYPVQDVLFNLMLLWMQIVSFVKELL